MQSIHKVKTFTPASADRALVYAQLAKNIENACIKARRYKLAAQRAVIFLLHANVPGLRPRGRSCRGRPVFPLISSGPSEPAFDAVFVRRYPLPRDWRHSAPFLAKRITGSWICSGKWCGCSGSRTSYESIDALSAKYGKHTALSRRQPARPPCAPSMPATGASCRNGRSTCSRARRRASGSASPCFWEKYSETPLPLYNSNGINARASGISGTAMTSVESRTQYDTVRFGTISLTAQNPRRHAAGKPFHAFLTGGLGGASPRSAFRICPLFPFADASGTRNQVA